MAIRKTFLIAGFLAIGAAAPALADVLPTSGLRYRVGIGFGPGESVSGGDVGYHKYVSGNAKGQLEVTLAPVAAINAAVSNQELATDIYASAFLSYAYAVNFTAASGMVLNDLKLVSVTGVASLATTEGGSISAGFNDGSLSFSCANGAGSDCGTNNFGFTATAYTYQEADQLDGTSIYTLFGNLLMNGNLVASANLLSTPGYFASAQLYLDPVITLNNAFAGANNASNIVVELSPGVANASGEPVALPAVPEPASWAMLVAGFGMMGIALRRRRAAMA